MMRGGRDQVSAAQVCAGEERAASPNLQSIRGEQINNEHSVAGAT